MNSTYVKSLVALSLLAAIVQPAQAATYTDHAKKISRYTFNIAKIVGGFRILLWQQNYARGFIPGTVRHYATITTPISLAACTAINSGWNGLKTEWSLN